MAQQNFRRGGQGGGGQQKPPRIEFDTSPTGCRVVISAEEAHPGYFVHIFGRALDGNQTLEGGMVVYGRKLPAADNLAIFCDGDDTGERLTLQPGTGHFGHVLYYPGPDNPFRNTVKVGIQLMGTVLREEISLPFPDKLVIAEAHIDPAGTPKEAEKAKETPTPDKIEISPADYPRQAGSLDLPDLGQDFKAAVQVTAGGKGVKAKVTAGSNTAVETDDNGFVQLSVKFRHMDDVVVFRVVGTQVNNDKPVTPRLWVR